MNKRGDLLKEALEVILFAIGAVLIIFAIVKVYNLTVNQENENARSIRDNIATRVESLKEGETGEFILNGLEGWFLVGWSRAETSRPDKCFFNSCICICKGDMLKATKTCQENGFCKEFKEDKIILLRFLKEKGKEMIVKEEEVIKDLNNPRYYEGETWAIGANPYILLHQCPRFYKNNLVKFVAYRASNGIAIFMIEDSGVPSDPDILFFGRGCRK